MMLNFSLTLLKPIALPDLLPRVAQDLYDMFDLSNLAAEVARERPNGEKNALRKTYKGHIRRLGVAGHFDVQKKPDNAPSEFMSMIQVPDLEWDVHMVKGKEMGSGLSGDSLSKLGRAMTMAKGAVSKGLWDASVLGDLAPGGVESKTPSAKPTAPNTPLPLSGAAAPARSKPQGPPGQDPARPKRNVRKRGYGDSSFEGYNEAFPDSDGPDDLTEEENSQKRRKKVGSNSWCLLHHMLNRQNSANSPYPSAVRQQSYGPGMVGA